jgi:hypothetical protein
MVSTTSRSIQPSGMKSGHGNDSDTEGTLREELTREPFLVIAGVH